MWRGYLTANSKAVLSTRLKSGSSKATSSSSEEEEEEDSEKSTDLSPLLERGLSRTRTISEK